MCTCSRPFLLLSVCIIFFYALNHCIFNYRYLVEEIKKREGFQLILEVSENGTELLLLLGGCVCLLFDFVLFSQLPICI